MPEIIVLGAGLSGLGFSCTLRTAEQDFCVFEKENHPGGHAYSETIHGISFDQGAHISHSKNHEFLSMIHRNAIDVSCIAPSIVASHWQRRWIGYPVQNHLHSLPLKERIQALVGLLTAHLTPTRTAPVDYEEWCLSQYGHHLTHNFYRVFTHKYWRTPMNMLSTDWLGGRLLPSILPTIIKGAFHPQIEKQTVFTLFHYPTQGGFFSFFRPSYDNLPIHYGQDISLVDVESKYIESASGQKEYYDLLASSIPLNTLVGIIKDVPPEIREASALLLHTQLMCINIILTSAPVKYHWCYVYDEDIYPARISFPTNLTGNNTLFALQAEIFRHSREEWSPEQLFATALPQLADLFHFNMHRDLVSATFQVVPYAYIISDHDRARHVATIHSWLKTKNIRCMGLYGNWKYMWSDVAYYSGVALAQQILQDSTP